MNNRIQQNYRLQPRGLAEHTNPHAKGYPGMMINLQKARFFPFQDQDPRIYEFPVFTNVENENPCAKARGLLPKCPVWIAICIECPVALVMAEDNGPRIDYYHEREYRKQEIVHCY
mmetsp:Transcript_3062/g.6600  ORF Transcript_3062/g.6600 Transcript_3062/m.6600 type:complete len:116 (+) Transcript_3062:2089-2436(+)